MKIFDFENKNDFKNCELPVEKIGDKYAIVYTNNDMNEFYTLKTENQDWSNYNYLAVLVYSAYSSGSVMQLSIGTEDDDLRIGFLYPINVSWPGNKLLFIPLKEAIRTVYNPKNGIDSVKRINILRYWGEFGPGKTEIKILDMYLTNEDNSREYFIETDDNIDFTIAGNKNTKYDVTKLLKDNNPNKKHPRLICMQEDFDNLKRFCNENEYIKSCFLSIKKCADEYLTQKPEKFVLKDKMRLNRDVIGVILKCVMAYKITDERKYFERAYEEIESICHYPDWNPCHDLDPGDYARVLALAYDYLYNDLSEKQKRVIRNAICKNAFEPMITQLRKKIHYAIHEGNHNTVISSGLGLAALAIGDEEGYEDICNEIINETIVSVVYNLKTFGPEGICPEGPRYWEYGQGCFYFYEAALFSALKTDFGLMDLPGLSTTGDYLLAVNSVINKAFNYYDCGTDNSTLSPYLMWLAKLYNKKEYSQRFLQGEIISKSENNKEGFSSRDDIAILLFYREDMNNFEEGNEKQDYFFEYLGSMKNDSSYVGFKGGVLSFHMKLDCGTFVYDTFGERWILELLSENYDMPGNWEYGVDAGRWTYYRNRAEGNNTIIINPKYNRDYTADQNPDAKCFITDKYSSTDESYAKVDLTSISEDARAVSRTFKLNKKENILTIVDEIELKEKGEFYSFMHTDAEAKLIDNNTVLLKKNDKELKIKIEASENVEIYIDKAEPLMDEYKNTPHKNNDDFRRIVIHGKNIIKENIRIEFKE